MPSFLLAPLRLELLRIEKPTSVVEPGFNPTRLPGNGEGRDLNAGTAFLGDEISSPPFQSRNLVLPPGTHLHWQLPHELTRGRPAQSGASGEGVHPQLPNRWLVIRTGNGERRRWIVESDYLHPRDHDRVPDATAYPILGPKWKAERNRAFRYLGRTLSLEEWLEEPARGDSLDSLTVMGYGNPAFAAFAPNALGVFTFHDPDLREAEFYTVAGWYADPGDEPAIPIREAVAGVAEADGKNQRLRSRILCAGNIPAPLTGAPTIAAPLTETPVTEVSVTEAQDTEVLIVETPLTDVPVIETPVPPPLPKPETEGPTETDGVRIAIGNSASEALSALVAKYLHSANPAIERSVFEDQLEAILMAADLDHRLQDHHPKFLERRHANGFTAFHGGIRWLIKPEAPVHGPANAERSIKPGGPPIPKATIAPLHTLNVLQRKLESLQNTRRTLLERLSSDWHKYMLCAYPPPATRDEFPDADMVAHLIRSTTVKAIGRIDAEILAVSKERDSVANEIQRLLPPQNPEHLDESYLRLKTIPGPRFWAPRDPVAVVIARPEFARHLPGANQRITSESSVQWRDLDVPHGDSEALPFETQFLEEILREWSEEEGIEPPLPNAPARPIYVEWSAQWVADQRAAAEGARDFDPAFLESRFAPAAGSPDLVRRALGKKGKVVESAYTGRALVSVHAAQTLHESLVRFLEGKDEDQGLVATARRALRFLEENRILCLPLGGFHDALLMRRQTVQLPIAEPIGFPEYRKFSDELRALVGELPTAAPVPLAEFNPIRNGELQLDRLRLIDSFGCTFDIEIAKNGIIASEPLRGEASIAFPPRFVQPMRVDFRWLSAGHDDTHSHSHPDTTPVCGWLLPNRLDESLSVHDANGDGLGSIDISGVWRPVPGEDHPIVPRDIENPHLRRVVLQILARDRDFQAAFLQTINAALEAIDPDSFAAHPAVSLLLGRPVAVVRASVQFELLGEPAEDHSWELVEEQIAGRKVDRSRRFEDVEIPFRIGEHHMLNDGVVGYWIEDGSDGFKNDLFHAPQTDEPRHGNIVSYHGESLGPEGAESQDLVLKMALSDPPVALTMLMDPRGAAHLTSGVLPVKEIRLAENHFTEALKNISVTFLSTPLLMLEDRTEILLPGEPGYAWSFLDRTPEGWRETPASDITQPELDAAFRTGLGIREGWLRLEPNEDKPAGSRDSSIGKP